MTREEAVVVLKTFMENPLFSEVHKAAFNIAIHDIKQRHDWDINKLMLVSKTEWEQDSKSEWTHDHEILRAYADGANNVLEKIRSKIQSLRNCSCSCSDGIIDDVEDIIDKYRTESEDKA